MTRTSTLIAALAVAGALASPSLASAQDMMCEDTSARVARSFIQTTRNKSQIGFMLRLDVRNRQATIMGVQGTRIIRPSRHPLTEGADGRQVVMNWTDNNNMPRTVTITFNTDGSFFGRTEEVPVNAQANALACGLMGSDLCGMMSVSAQTEISRVCWARD